MKPNFEYFSSVDNRWVPIRVNHITGCVYYTNFGCIAHKSIYRWTDKFWLERKTRTISSVETKTTSPKDRQVGGDHYKHYRIQPSEFIRANNIGWYEANAIKRICRHQDKNGREDIEKAIHELEFILEEYDNKNKENN